MQMQHEFGRAAMIPISMAAVPAGGGGSAHLSRREVRRDPSGPARRAATGLVSTAACPARTHRSILQRC